MCHESHTMVRTTTTAQLPVMQCCWWS